MKAKHIVTIVFIVFLALLTKCYLDLAAYYVYPDRECLSPSKEYAATLFTAGGGGGAGWMATYLTVWKVSEGFDPDERAYWVRSDNEILFRWIDSQRILILTSKTTEPTEEILTIDDHEITLIYRNMDSKPKGFRACPDRTVFTNFKIATWTGWYWKDVVKK